MEPLPPAHVHALAKLEEVFFVISTPNSGPEKHIVICLAPIHGNHQNVSPIGINKFLFEFVVLRLLVVHLLFLEIECPYFLYILKIPVFF